MANPPKLETCDFVLIVEGYSDLLFYAELLELLGKHEQTFIKHFNGRSDLAAKLETFLTPQLLVAKRAFGVIVDADKSANATSAELAKILQGLTGQPIVHCGWTASKPRVGLFVTPDGKSNGEIETLVWKAWSTDPTNSEAKACIERFVTCMSDSGIISRSPDKGLISALLAIRNDEDPRLGPGARAKAFDFARPEFLPLKDFLSGLA